MKNAKEYCDQLNDSDFLLRNFDKLFKLIDITNKKVYIYKPSLYNPADDNDISTLRYRCYMNLINTKNF